MKLLHTADWHVGRTLRGRNRSGEHREVLAEIARLAAEHEVELIIVAGDLFDTAAPGPDAEHIVYTALMELARTGAEVIVIGGNHDNPRRLAAVRPLLDLTRVRTVAFPQPPDRGGVIELRARSGARVQIAVLPFVSQRGIVRVDQLMAGEAAEHVQQYADRCRRIVEQLCAGFGPDSVNLIVAHLTVAGGAVGGGEREAHTVFDYHVPSQVFPATAHYVALGHLHRLQQVPGACPIWYSGAPLQLDFGESANEPSVLIADVEPGLPARVQPVPLAAGRRLRTVGGTVDQLVAIAGDVGEDFLRVFVAEPARIGLADDVRVLFPNAVDVVVRREDAVAGGEDAWTPDQARHSPAQLFAEYLSDRNVDDPQVEKLFRDLLEDATHGSYVPRGEAGSEDPEPGPRDAELVV